MDFCGMDLAPIERMRERAKQLRRMMRMAHDSEMIELFRNMADAIETDADNLEHQLRAGGEATQSVH
jgi:polyhydroxyalkanoate synthesis regulator protein